MLKKLAKKNWGCTRPLTLRVVHSPPNMEANWLH
jgi:hypothetical protein